MIPNPREPIDLAGYEATHYDPQDALKAAHALLPPEDDPPRHWWQRTTHTPDGDLVALTCELCGRRWQRHAGYTGAKPRRCPTCPPRHRETIVDRDLDRLLAAKTAHLGHAARTALFLLERGRVEDAQAVLRDGIGKAEDAA